MRGTFMRMDVGGKGRKGRPKRSWMDHVNVEFRDKRLSRGEMQNVSV